MASFDTKPTFREKLAYKIDYLMAQSPLMKLAMLFIFSVIIVIIGGVAYALVAGELDFLHGLWRGWMFVADGGSMGEEETVATRAVAIVVTIGGLLVFALLLGLVSETLGEKLDDLKKGRSRVIESNHTLVLGWEEKIFTLLEELIEANSNVRRAVVVVLADEEKEMMEEEIQSRIPDTRSTAIVVRSGSITDVRDLLKVNAPGARATVVLGDRNDPTESDTRAIKAVLALQRGVGSLQGHITVEVMEPVNKPIVEMIGGGNVEVVLPGDMIGRLMVQTARQNGLAQTYTELLGFEGSEFYVEGYKELAGKKFRDVWPLFPDAVVCGVKTDQSGPARGQGGPQMWINPPEDYTLGPNDELLILAEDDDTFSIKNPPIGWQRTEPPPFEPAQPQPERLLFLGWRQDLGVMVRELDEYVAKGSTLTLVSSLTKEEASERLKLEGIGDLKNVSVRYWQGNLAARRDLEMLKVQEYDSILVLADDSEEGREPEEVDARTLMSLLLIRDIQKKNGVRGVPVLSEIRDPRTKELAKVAEASDYVVSNELVSMLLSQVAENRAINDVWADLFQSEGSEIYLKNAHRYAGPNETVTFYDIMGRARAKAEIALGYRKADQADGAQAGVFINPADKTVPLVFTAADSIIVLSEDDS